MSLTTVVLSVSLAAVTGGATTPCPVVVHERYKAVASGDYTAVTYNPELVPPVDSAVTVVSYRSKNDTTRVVLHLSGLTPGRTYGAHVHTKSCGADPAAAGPHYQHVPDPAQPSTDPRYANPHNEVWLDFATDEEGNGWAMSSVGWRFRKGEARSVVVHEHATDTRPGRAGDAGARLACVDVPFT